MTADTVARPGNLPAEPNSFVGRERDLGDLALLLSNVRTLTLCGPGGIGKTRLAVRLGRDLADDFPDGVWLVELADNSDPGLTVNRIATVLGLRAEPDRPASATVIDALAARELLLILDTCEHVVTAVAELVRDLIAGCPRIRIVTTSREPLRVRGETVWRVPPLSLPVPEYAPAALQAIDEPDLVGGENAEYEAVRLFVDRAAAVRPGFELTARNRAAVVQLCRTLDGVPLAIELAAARVRTLSTEQIAARIDDRFHLLAIGDRTAPPRQQTLEAAVDWSFDLLTSDEQVLLRRLSIFVGWNLEMAEEVCSDDRIPKHRVLDLLAGLIDKSLVVLDEELGGAARYRLLDTIRAYAVLRLMVAGEDDEFGRRHMLHMVALAEGVVAKAFVRGAPPWPERVAMYHRIAIEQSNFRAALAFCQSTSEAEHGLRLCSALRSPWIVQGDVAEGVGWFTRFLEMNVAAPAAVRARALMFAAELSFEQQDYGRAAKTALTVVDMRYEPVCRAGALHILALVSLRAGAFEQALQYADAAVSAAREYRDDWEEGLALAARAAILARSGRLASAQSAYEYALEVLADNNGWGVAHALYGFGSLARTRRDDAGAQQHFRNALELFRQIDARTEIARCLAGIGWVALAKLDLDTAATSLSESLELSMVTGQRLGIARGLEAMAALAVVRGDDEAAARLEGAAGVIRDAVGPVRSATAQARLDRLLAASHQRLGPARVTTLVAEGRLLDVREAVSYALRSAHEPAPPPEPAAISGHTERQGEPAGTASLARAADGTRAAGPARTASTARASNNGAVPSVLTAREQQIAALIARGLSNRGIADELVISPATAARHVANILSKLGLSSRAQIAAWTAANGAGH